MNDARETIGKVLYGALFALVLPCALVAWARAIAPAVRAPVVASIPLGASLFAAGIALILCGWWALKFLGGGLPMNAFPPPRLVTGGVFALVAHPIYVGFCAACAGASIALGSASGLYVVTPTMILACVALVLGYEGPALRARLGARSPPWLWLAPDDAGAPTWSERLAAYGVAVAPWCAIYELLAALGVAPDAFSLALPGEQAWPVIEGAELVYASAYVAVLAAPLAVPTRRALRELEVRACSAMALVFPLYFVLPVIAEPRAFTPHSALGRLLALERALDTPGEAFPSFHVIWALLAARAFAARRGAAPFAWGWAMAVAASCVATGMHTVLDVAGGFAAYAVVARAPQLWERARAAAERIAGSWREWRIGPVRVINHGAYAAVGTAGALVIVSALVGRGHALPIAIAALAGLVTSALWAQFIEGSAALMRPYGFYGGVLGIILGAFAAPLFGVPVWSLLGAYCVAAPVVQSLGRVRCLVQGCCHGSPCGRAVGIVYRHPRSRVTRIAHLAGIALHPTPLYSILWNVVVGVVMARLWSLRVDTHFVAGVYLLMTGLGRFVEEGYRGEPQTPKYGGLRLYQWIAGGTAVAGAVITAIGRSAPAGAPDLDAPSVGVALAVGVVVGCALGVDFPESDRRFSRLA